MSRFFKYKTPEALLADAKALGVDADVRLSDELGALFQEASIAGRRVGNRLTIQPMEGCDGDPDGSPGELTYRRFSRFGAGGAKLIWGEACAVVADGRANPRQLVINEKNLDSLARLVQVARSAHVEANGQADDLLVGLQLTHSGRYSYQKPILAQHDPLLDPRTLVDRKSGAVAGAEYPLIADAELDRLQDHYIAAAALAARAGFRLHRPEAVPPVPLE